MMRNTTLVLVATLLACSGDDRFGGTPTPRPGDSDRDQTPPLGIAPGDTFSYAMYKTYDPDPVPSDTLHEKTVFGHVCFKVTAVDDGFPEGRASSITAQVKVSGTNAGEDLFFADDDTPDPDSPTAVDAYMRPLWLAGLTFDTRGHGYASAASVPFSTRQSIAPDPSQSLNKLPFFDARDSADEHGWRGWADYSVDFFAYFQERFGTEYYASDDVDFSVLSALGCEDATSAATCPPGQCLWDFQTNECVGQLSIDIAWRDSASVWSAPGEFADDPVIHHIRVGYTVDGYIRNYDEYVFPDRSGGAPVSIGSTQFTTCPGDHVPCAKAGFNSETWANSECRF